MGDHAVCECLNQSFMKLGMYRVRQANFLFHMALAMQKRKLACRTLYIKVSEPT
jgi:hypothetical protein